MSQLNEFVFCLLALLLFVQQDISLVKCDPTSLAQGLKSDDFGVRDQEALAQPDANQFDDDANRADPTTIDTPKEKKEDGQDNQSPESPDASKLGTNSNAHLMTIPIVGDDEEFYDSEKHLDDEEEDDDNDDFYDSEKHLDDEEEDDDNDDFFGTEKHLDDEKESHEAVEINKKSLFAQVGDYAKRFVAPAKYYIDLARRYHSWYRRYNLLQQKVKRNGKPVLRNALDTLKIEYAKVDQKLINEACTPQKEPLVPVDVNQVENVDYIKNALDKLIGELESKLAQLEQRDWGAAETDADSEAAKEEQAALDRINKMEQETSVQLAMDRAKRIAKKQARQIAVYEIADIVAVAVLQLVTYLTTGGMPMDTTSWILKSLILLHGGPQKTFTERYFHNLKFRAVLKLLNHSLSSLSCPKSKNPMVNKDER